MITAFSLTKDKKVFRFKSTCINKFKQEPDKYTYSCGGRKISEEDYVRNLEAFRRSRK